MTMLVLGGGIAPGVSSAPIGATATTLGVGAVGSVMVWLGVLLVVVLVGGFALLFLRRWLFEPDGGEGSTGWDLHALRQMRDRGDLSDAEYESARARIIGALSGESGVSTTPAPPGGAESPPRSGGELRARPGFDLTGEPLPDFSGDGENAADDSEGPKK